MQLIELKEKLHHFIDIAKDEQLKAIYTLLEDKIESANYRISIDQYNEEMQAAEDRIDAGEYYTQDQIEKLIGK